MFLAYHFIIQSYIYINININIISKPDSNLKIIPILQKILAYFKLLLKINILMIYFPRYLILAFNFYNKNYCWN